MGSSTKNFLFVLDNYLPNASANGICCHHIMNALAKAGNNVSCVVEKDYDQIEFETIDNIKIYRVNKHTQFKIINKMYGYLLRLLKIFFYPYMGDFIHICKIVNKIKIIIEKEKIGSVVYVYKPLITLFAEKKLKNKYPEITHIFYMLDSFSGGQYPRYLSQRAIFKKRLKFETKLFSYADKIILMESSRQHIEKYYKGTVLFDKMFFLDIPLLNVKNQNYSAGHFDLLFKSKINVLFAGTIKRRNFLFILDLIKKIDREDVTFLFVVRHFIKKDFLKFSENLGKDKIIFKDAIPYGEISELLVKANIFLNLGNNEKNMTPSKIFEYMSFGKPIISTYRIDDDACLPYLQNYPTALLLDERKGIEYNASLLNDFIDSYINGSILRQIDITKIADQFFNNTPQAFVDMIEKM